jgi:hypothetical protein
MDSVSRVRWLVRLVALVLAALVLQVAHASGQVPMGGQTYEYQIGSNGYFPSAAAACADQAARLTANSTTSNYSVVACDPNVAAGASFRPTSRATGSQGSLLYFNISRRAVAGQCPSGSTQLNSTTCVCTDPLVAKDGQCVPPCEGTVGKPFASGDYSVMVQGGGSAPAQACSGGCSFTLPEYEFSMKYGDKQEFIFDASKSKGNGMTCTPSSSGPDPKPEPKPDPLPPGQCPGTVNGVAVIVPCDSTSTPGPKTSNPAPTTTPPPSGGGDPANGPPGTKNEDTKTTCAGDKCTTTTTTTTTNPDGSTTTETENTTEPRDDYCQKNPASLQCEDKKSAWGGSCGAFTCGGDAVQCAIAQEQHRRNCELFEASDASARGISAAAAGDRPGDHPRNGMQSVSIGTGFDQTNLLSGSCPGDQTVSIGSGRSVVLPWSKLCEPAAMLGNVLVGITALACLGIVFKG